ncbi:F0F1 ATP synthase subunit delta, partial [Patescibacteria group bacterium]|nr:F0F1 ATP synthase subunit delta [Patescibacteria group bacterium]
RTTDDLVKFDEEMDLLLQSIYYVDKDMLKDALEKTVRIRVATVMRKLIQRDTLSKREEINALFLSVYKTICSLPMLQLTLAFEPSEAVIDNISRWARQNLAAGILLDLSLDRSVLGGAMIMYNGRFYDLTLRKNLQGIFDKGDLRLG